jgi:hypothetical protein
LNLNDQQLGRLNQLNDQVRGRFRDQFGQLDRLNDAQRAARSLELTRTMNTEFLRSANDIFTPQQLNRFRQLQLQQQGLNAFGDPALVQRLNLTDIQQRDLRLLNERMNQELQNLSQGAQVNQEEALRRFEALRRQTLERTNGILNDQQQQMWREMTGEPFNFPPPNFSGRSRR